MVTPLLDSGAGGKLAEDVERELSERYPDVGWSVTAVRDSLVTAPALLTEIVDAARSRLLDERWDLVVHVTELPLRIARRPVLTHSSRTHRVALVSLPALGIKQSDRRLVQSVVDAVGVFAGDTERRRGRTDVVTDGASGGAWSNSPRRWRARRRWTELRCYSAWRPETSGWCWGWFGPTIRGGWSSDCRAR